MQKKDKKLIDKYFHQLYLLLSELDRDDLIDSFKVVENKLKQRKSIFLAGNGGSAATASHALVDLNKTILGHGRNYRHIRLRVISLADNIPILTAIGNDFSYKNVFSESLKNLANPGDLLIVLSGSGKSPNIISALNTAKDLQVETLGLLGFDGGKAKKLVDHKVLVPSESYGHIEDVHMIYFHLLTEYLKTALIKRD